MSEGSINCWLFVLSAEMWLALVCPFRPTLRPSHINSCKLRKMCWLCCGCDIRIEQRTFSDGVKYILQYRLQFLWKISNYDSNQEIAWMHKTSMLSQFKVLVNQSQIIFFEKKQFAFVQKRKKILNLSSCCDGFIQFFMYVHEAFDYSCNI